MFSTSVRCTICGQEIKVTGDNFLQQLAIDAFRDLKTHFHYKNFHNTGYLKRKGVIKRILWIILVLLFSIPLAVIWFVTFPFWWIHEKIS